MEAMTSSKPYLIRAIYDWIIDNGLTPYIVIDAEADDVQVPEDYIEDGQIILNISPDACRGLHLENDRVVFSATFSGAAKQIYAPPASVIAVYAKENGRGMIFGEEEESEGLPSPPEPTPSAPTDSKGSSLKKKPKLKIIK